jgi:putative NIF3 family GTP cyclohydrolase 1 type 2
VQEGTYRDGTPISYGRIGQLSQPLSVAQYLVFLKSSLQSNGLRYFDAGKTVHRVAVVGGSGGDYLEKAFAFGCDTLITGDAKYDAFLTARELGVNLIDADHFCTENTVVPILARYIADNFRDVTVIISEKHNQTVKFFA